MDINRHACEIYNFYQQFRDTIRIRVGNRVHERPYSVRGVSMRSPIDGKRCWVRGTNGASVRRGGG